MIGFEERNDGETGQLRQYSQPGELQFFIIKRLFLQLRKIKDGNLVSAPVFSSRRIVSNNFR
jgi:hypothetical protein